mgnify:CR=1 FL=1
MEAVWCKSRARRGATGELPAVVCLSLCGRDVADGLEQAPVVAPGYPFQRRQLESFPRFPRCTTVDELGLAEIPDCLGKGVVVAVATAADRRFDAGFGQTRAVADGQVLRSSVAVMDQRAITCWRACSARSRASSTKSVRIVVLTRQPTLRRAYTSITKATYSQPCQVET